MIWETTHRGDLATRLIADRHYSRQKPGTAQFVKPGRCVVLFAQNDAGRAYWVTSWPFAEYTKHAWAGAWECSAFRNEGAGVASEMIEDALAVTRQEFGDPPALGLVTFINRKKVNPIMVRGRPVYGWTFIKAGFEYAGETKGGLLVLRIRPENMPAAAPASKSQVDFFA